MSPAVSYDSQSVLSTLEGLPEVWEYLSGKIRTLKRSQGRQPLCELATSIYGDPCVLVYQPRSTYDANWLNVPVAFMVIKTDDQGLAKEFSLITMAPPPSSAKGSGIWPGAEENVQERPRPALSLKGDYRELRFTYYLLNGEMSLDKRAVEESEKVLEAFPGAERRIIIALSPNAEEYDEIRSVGFLGFPSVAVFWKEEAIYRHEGLASAEALITAVKSITTLDGEN
jgi:hypothetical protein